MDNFGSIFCACTVLSLLFLTIKETITQHKRMKNAATLIISAQRPLFDVRLFLVREEYLLFLLDTIVWCLFRNVDVMWMTLFQRSSGNFNKASVLLQIFNRLCSTISHTGTDSTNQLEYRILY